MTRARVRKATQKLALSGKEQSVLIIPFFSDFHRCSETLVTALMLHVIWNSWITTKLKCGSSEPNHCLTETELGQYKWGTACVPCYRLLFFPWAYCRYQCDSSKCKVLFRHQQIIYVYGKWCAPLFFHCRTDYLSLYSYTSPERHCNYAWDF